MDTLAFLKTRQAFDSICEKILGVKGEVYAREEAGGDRLGNFKRTADLAGVDPVQVALVFFMKHVDSISSWIAKGAPIGQGLVVGGEHIVDRLADARNYIDIIEALIVDRIPPSDPTMHEFGLHPEEQL